MAKAKTLRWERRPDDRPQELLEAALRVFAQQGYAGTRLDDVAEAAGVTKGTIYHYFDTKEELLFGAIDHHTNLAFSRIDEVVHDVHLPASTRIRLLLRKLFSARSESSRHLLTLLLRASPREMPGMHERWLNGGPVRLWTLITQIVDEGKKRGEFRPEADGDIGARLLVSGLLLLLAWDDDANAAPALAIDEDRLIESGADLFLAGLQVANSPRPARRPARRVKQR